MFMSNSLSGVTAYKSSGWLSDAFNWGKKNLSLSNIDKLGKSISNVGQSITGAINSGKNALASTAADLGAAAGQGFFDKNRWWILGGAGLLAFVLIFSMSRRK